MPYDFTDQLGRGQSGEAVLRAYFEELGCTTRAATDAEQRCGIDFWIEWPGRCESVEVKTDELAGRTHNAFIETVSVDTEGKPGWALTCSADILAYYIPGDGLAYLLKPDCLRERLAHWQRCYPTRTAPNRGYRTHGVLVPLAELECAAEAAICP